MIDLEKLTSQFDINNFDAGRILQVLVEYQKAIAFVLLIGSLLLVVGMFGDHRSKETILRTQISQEQGKMDAIKARGKAIEDLADFKSSIPKELNVFDLITLISNYAKLYNTTVTSYSPNQSKDVGLYSVIDVSFSTVSDNFKDMALFLRKIEKSKFPITVNSWSGSEQDDGSISVKLEISAVLIHP